MAEYSEMMDGYFHGGVVMCTLAVARELGIVQHLLDISYPVTSQELADKLTLKERYVRELLACLATSEIINVDESSTLFHVPEEKKKKLQGISIFSRNLPLMGELHSNLKNCFRKSGPEGIQYRDYPIVFDIIDEVLTYAKPDIIDLDILPAVPGLTEKLENGIDVGEFGSATGIILNKLAARFPKSHFQGSDVVQEPLDVARTNAAKDNLTNVTFQLHDLDSLPESMKEKFDWVFTRDVIHDLPDPQEAVYKIYHSIKPGGIYSMIDVALSGDVYKDVSDSWAAHYYSLSTHFCVPASYQRSNSMAVGAGWGRPLAREVVKKAGFTIVAEKTSEYDPKEVHYVCQK